MSLFLAREETKQGICLFTELLVLVNRGPAASGLTFDRNRTMIRSRKKAGATRHDETMASMDYGDSVQHFGFTLVYGRCLAV